MATGAQLADLIKEVQYELGHNVSTTVGQNFRDHIANRIRREYKRLYEDFTWPHLRAWVDLPLVAATKSYQLPSLGGKQIKLGDLQEVFVKWGGVYTPLHRGIEIDDYNALNSDDGQSADPAAKWAPVDETHIEVWPLPASAGSLRFLIKKPFVQMAIETDTCALDDDVVVLFAAAEYMLRQGSKEAQAVMLRAEQRFKTLRQRLQTGANKVNVGGLHQHVDPRDPRGKVFVGVGTR